MKLEEGKWYKFGPTASIPFLVLKIVDGGEFVHWRWMGDPENRIQSSSREKLSPYVDKIVEYSFEEDVFRNQKKR